jgi:hypothetical protein
MADHTLNNILSPVRLRISFGIEVESLTIMLFHSDVSYQSAVPGTVAERYAIRRGDEAAS